MLRRLAVTAALALLLTAVPLTSAHAIDNEQKTVGGACGASASPAEPANEDATDWDTIMECSSGAWKRAPYFLGSTGDTCDASHAGMVQYTGGVFEGCNGSSWVKFPGMVLIATKTASNSASLSWTGLGSTYNIYKLHCNGLLPVNDANLFYLQVGEGGTPTWEASSYANRLDEAASNNGAASQYTLSSTGLDLTGNDVSNLSTDPGTVDVTIYNVPSTSLFKDIVIYDVYRPTSGGFAYLLGGGYWNGDTNAITAIRLQYNSGNISVGTCSLYGLNQ